MHLAITYTRSLVGIEALAVNVEVDLSFGLPGFAIVGLAQAAVRESKDRVRSALLNTNFEFPCRKITVNLAPADVPKSGCGFDLPIALGILAASAQIPQHKLTQHEFIGELALDGSIRGVNSIIPATVAARKADKYLIISTENAAEASLVGYTKVFAAANLLEVVEYLRDKKQLNQLENDNYQAETSPEYRDWSDIRGQSHAKMALEIAACGGHSALLNGPPGSGKTLLAKTFNTILPQLSINAALDCMAIQAVAGIKASLASWRTPPLRDPHHTASQVSLVGGGNPPKPGEISLAHNGVLFLDELPEFNRAVLETLREPLEAGRICISRAAMQTEFPANFQLIAAMNPCPCGQFGNPQGNCICTPDKINRYLGKLSGPLLDRIDILVTLLPLPHTELLNPNHSEPTSDKIKQQVILCRERQLKRQGKLNAFLNTKQVEQACALDAAGQELLHTTLSKLKFSARAMVKLLKVARTIADMRAGGHVNPKDLQQALTFKGSLQHAKN